MSRRLLLRRTCGFTLIELLISMTVMSILGGVLAVMFSAALDSWTHVERRLDLQIVAQEMMEKIFEGGFEGEGLRDGVELRTAEPDEVAVVSLWTDRSHRPNPAQNPEQKFTLEKQFKAGATVPIGQVRRDGSDEWVNVPVLFDLGPGSDPKRPDDVVTFPDRLSAGTKIRIIYTPDAAEQPETIMRFRFDPKTRQVTRTYGGRTVPIPGRLRGVKIEDLSFHYFDNLNEELPVSGGYTPAEMRRITGIRVHLLISRGQERQELTSFTNVRNVQTVGVTVSEGVELPLPSAQAIKAFSLGDLSGLRRDGIVQLEAVSGDRARWKITLQFKPGARESELLLERFQIESPPGRVRASGFVNETVSRSGFVNLLTIDRTGLFDYDDDADVSDSVMVPGTKNKLEVVRCDFDIAALFIRP